MTLLGVIAGIWISIVGLEYFIIIFCHEHIESREELYDRLLRPIIMPYLAYKWFKNLPEK